MTCEMLGLGRRELEYLFEHCDQTYRTRLLHLEVWAHMCLYGMSEEAILERLNTHSTINSM